MSSDILNRDLRDKFFDKLNEPDIYRDILNWPSIKISKLIKDKNYIKFNVVNDHMHRGQFKIVFNEDGSWYVAGPHNSVFAKGPFHSGMFEDIRSMLQARLNDFNWPTDHKKR